MSCNVELLGGGAGGGPAATAVALDTVSGGGGGSGGYSRIALPAPLVVGGVNVVVGLGGLAATDGGTTAFGSFCNALGGNAGAENDGSTTFGAGGSGGAPGVGDLAMPGSPGGNGTSRNGATNQAAWGGTGGEIWGGANQTPEVGVGYLSAGANAWVNSGAGGTGGCINQVTGGGNVTGGTGGSGLCIVTEYCVSPGGSDCGCGPARVSYGWDCR